MAEAGRRRPAKAYEHVRGSGTCACSRQRAAGCPHAAAHTRRVRRAGAHHRPRARTAPSHRRGSPAVDGPVGTARLREDHPRAHHGLAHPITFRLVSAVASGVADLRRVVAEAAERLGQNGQRTILFIDEIHRFNKAQQDVVLPYVEDGTITLIGATTENPSFEVISPLLSRSRVFKMEPLTPEQVEELLRRALEDEERGLGTMAVEISDETLGALASAIGGDARIALNALELAAQTAQQDAAGARRVTLEHVEEALQHRAALYDRAGDWHYDIVSAFIKSIRGSDPDGALYWLARMLEGGEDPLFVARRLVILASEDVGLADPQALQVAVAAQQAVHFIGMPEVLPAGRGHDLPGDRSQVQLRRHCLRPRPPGRSGDAGGARPLHLRNAPTPLMKEMGHGRDYKYDHAFEGHYSGQQHLPDSLKGRRYYVPGELGYEERIREWMERLRGANEAP